ncbi:MAG: type VII secretion integral membrane protein EccD [Phycicoccus sp.]
MTPTTRIDLALPVQATVAEVVLQVVALAGSEESDPEAAAGGWLLSRLGGSPFPSGRSVGATDITDGDVLYLSRRSDRLPPVLFDDVIDAVAEATGARDDGWTAAATRRTAVGIAVALMLTATAALATAGAPWAGAIGTAVVIAVALVAGGAALSRAAGDSVVGAVTAMTALPMIAWAAARTVADPGSLVPTGPAPLLLSGAALVFTAALAALAVGDLVPVFVSAGLAGAAAALTGAVALMWDASALGVASTTAVLALLLTPLFPVLSVRLARMPSPTIPVDMAEFRRDETVTSADEMVTVARRTQAMLSALVAAQMAVVVPCLVVLLASGGRWPLTLAAALSAAAALRARQLVGVAPRLALLLTGILGLAGVTALATAAAEPWWRVAAAPAAAVLAAGLVLYASTVPRKGAAPYAGRLLDIVEFIALAALLPLLGVVLGLYARARGIGG